MAMDQEQEPTECHNCGKDITNLHHYGYEDEEVEDGEMFYFCMECVEEIGSGMPDEEYCPGDECEYCCD